MSLLLAAAVQVAIRNPPEVAPPVGAYSHMAVVPAGSELIVLAGQVGNAKDGSLPSEPEEQFRGALRNVAALLASEGLTPRDLVKLNLYLVRPLDPERARAIRAEVLGDARPPSTLIYVVRLARPEYLVEIDGMAVRAKR